MHVKIKVTSGKAFLISLQSALFDDAPNLDVQARTKQLCPDTYSAQCFCLSVSYSIIVQTLASQATSAQ
eukprot:758018-Prorocentrum_lima.AAC.1